jgi:hypothetical protein
MEAPFGFIQNCDWEIAIQCPQHWNGLDVTSDPKVRSCSTCLKSVYRCESEGELRQCVAEGKCVAFMYTTDGDFIGLLTVVEE